MSAAHRDELNSKNKKIKRKNNSVWGGDVSGSADTDLVGVVAIAGAEDGQGTLQIPTSLCVMRA